MPRTTLAVVLWLAAASAGAQPATDKKPTVAPATLPTLPKKLSELEAKRMRPAPSADKQASWQHVLNSRVNRAPARIVNIYNTWTREYVVIDSHAAADGHPDKSLIDDFFRCHFTNQRADMDPRLFETLVAAAKHFTTARIDIISGFRSPKYNLMLRKKGREVARRSQHTLGHAVDFRLRGVSVVAIRRWARRLRLGGVGYYPGSRFIHIDVGPIRTWLGR